AEIGAAKEIEVHREKRQIVRDVDAANAFAEFHAVENVHLLAGEMDVLAAQIAVAIEDAPARASPLKETRVALIISAGEIADRIESRTREQRADERFNLRKILVGAELQFLDAAPFRDR